MPFARPPLFIALLMILGSCDSQNNKLSPELERVQAELKTHVQPGPLTAKQIQARDQVMMEKFPAGAQITRPTEFYYDAKPTSCGVVWPKGKRERRYIYRNDAFLTEDDMSELNFEMFWQICVAGGAFWDLPVRSK